MKFYKTFICDVCKIQKRRSQSTGKCIICKRLICNECIVDDTCINCHVQKNNGDFINDGKYQNII